MHSEFEPPEDLKDSIKCFWYDRRDLGKQYSGFEVVPDGYAEIIFYFGSLSIILNDGHMQPLPSPFMIGLLNQPVTFYSKSRFEIIAIRCYPWTVFDLLGLQPGKDGLRVFEHPIAKLQPILNVCIEKGNIQGAITQVQQYCVDVRMSVAANTMLAKAGVAIRQANGALPVSGVEAAAHATVRTLERKFKQSSGYSVKDVSGLVRFEQVRNKLWQQPEINLAGLAYELGYSDQAHLSKEFKRYSGTTPAAFARNAKKDKQIIGSDFVAFVQD